MTRMITCITVSHGDGRRGRRRVGPGRTIRIVTLPAARRPPGVVTADIMCHVTVQPAAP